MAGNPCRPKARCVCLVRSKYTFDVPCMHSYIQQRYLTVYKYAHGRISMHSYSIYCTHALVRAALVYLTMALTSPVI